MNDAVPVPTEGLLTTADLATRPDFTLGLAVISPSSRTIAGPGGTAVTEPRVMQVLVVLAGAIGQVVTRETLFQRCWGSVYVGDDSLNRAIGAIRKLATDIAAGSFEIETIPRTGYRLRGNYREVMSSGAPVAELVPRRAVSRRSLIGGGVAAAALAGIGVWAATNTREDARFSALLDDAYAQIVKQTADEKTIKLLEEATAARPDSARAWGLLALLKSLLAHQTPDVGRRVDESENAARRALSLDPKEPNALLAMFELQGSTLDWITRDRRLRQIISVAPDNIGTIDELGALIAAAGLVKESWALNERAIALEPLSSIFLGKRALKLWVFGRTSEADKVSDQLQALYPTDPWPWFVRVQIYAFTGRARAALKMLDGGSTIPPMADLWRASLPAVDEPSPANVAKAREACIRAVQESGMAANEAILLMSRLGELDTAFAIADGTLLSRGPFIPPEQAGTPRAAENSGWRVNTQWMWVPPAAAMRADPRFLPMCEGIGLVEYWRKRGVKPDYMGTRA